MKDKIINLTPHEVNVDNTSFPSEGVVRVSQTMEIIGQTNGLNLVKRTFGSVEGLPMQEKGIYYIVSTMVQDSLPGRTDLLAPGELIRDSLGNVIGCKNLVIND